MNREKNMTGRRGAALLIVLIVIMAITVLSLGFLSRSDVELACGENMVLRTQMDYLAESSLEHAKGLILNPQDISSEYWTGAAR
jgi:type II secretory pathway component PulK